jgi:hypothetical protein
MFNKFTTIFMIVICAWCKCYLGGEDDGTPPSHGICADCAKKFEEKI